jgi:hypothetical protein
VIRFSMQGKSRWIAVDIASGEPYLAVGFQWGLVISQAHQIFRGTEYPISNKEFPTDQIFVYLPWILDIPCCASP